MKRFKTVDEFIAGAEQWQPELIRLREILSAMPMDECIKWGFPVYTTNNTKVVGLGCFKSYFGLWFFQGALLADESKVLVNAQKGVTKAMRQWRMTSMKEIKVRTIRAYVKEAMALADSGQQIKADRTKPITIPPELKATFVEQPKVAAAFKKMTLGRRREIVDYVSQAKRDDTKQKRITKLLPMILAGETPNDKYRR